MKTKKISSGLLILILLINFGCSEDSDLEPFQSDSNLKRTLLYSSTDSKVPISIVDEYNYDNQNRISKVSSPLYDNGNIIGTAKYDLYEYNSIGQLISISNFNANKNSPSGYINLKKYSYTYSSSGLREKQYIEYPQINSFEYALYFYNDNRLIKAEKYDSKEELENYTSYEYSNGNLIKEILHTSIGEALLITNHIYTNGLNTKTEVYLGNGKDKVREIKKIYNSSNNLTMVESNEFSPYSSLMSHVLRYEYY